ncbi:4362_t:CDS:2 [Funneliformis caledonium]|uniref:4362_t:CDS:1 n=1 Tax=Funneliformis caledonium TaxID=1117310 RepID=A0A9N9HST2_9GLOM|nr:4362_t:CDS:2 [Funneliformis caledonium]
MSEISELKIIPYTSKDYYASKNQQKKREPSMFMSFRKEKMKSKPTDISFADYFDEVTNLWKSMSEVERSEWQKNNNNNQDKKFRKDHKIENHVGIASSSGSGVNDYLNVKFHNLETGAHFKRATIQTIMVYFWTDLVYKLLVDCTCI